MLYLLYKLVEKKQHGDADSVLHNISAKENLMFKLSVYAHGCFITCHPAAIWRQNRAAMAACRLGIYRR